MGSDVVVVIKYGPATLYRIMRELGTGPSRRERRRARKAAKNLAMYKLAGRRPWNWWQDVCNRNGDILDIPTCRLASEPRMSHLREPSGFKAMSGLAESLSG